MSDKISVGFVGCGLIARSHARGLASVADVEVVAVHDLDEQRSLAFAEEFAGSRSRSLPDAASVIAASDAVYVCTWTAAHPDLVVAVAEAGRAVFCEKPLAIDLAEATRMTEAVIAAGVVNQVGLVLRRSPAMRWLHHRATSDAVGPMMNIVFRDDQYLPTQGMYGSTWRGDRTLAGAGTLLEHSIHDFDLLRWMMGPISRISSQVGMLHELDGIDDQSSVMLLAENGAQATLTSVWHEVLSRPSQRRVEVFCRDAVLTVDGDWRGPVSVESAEDTQELTGAALIEAAARIDGLGVNPDAAFIDAVRTGAPAYPDFSIALDAHQIVDAAYRSAANEGQPVGL